MDLKGYNVETSDGTASLGTTYSATDETYVTFQDRNTQPGLLTSLHIWGDNLVSGTTITFDGWLSQGELVVIPTTTIDVYENPNVSGGWSAVCKLDGSFPGFRRRDDRTIGLRIKLDAGSADVSGIMIVWEG